MTQPQPAAEPASPEQAREFSSVVKNCAIPSGQSSSDAVRVYTVGMTTASAIELWRARREVRRAFILIIPLPQV